MKKEKSESKKNKIINYFIQNFFVLILILILIYMQATDQYIHTKETPVYVEICNGEPTGYAEYPENGQYVGGNIKNTERQWMLNISNEYNHTT